MIFLRFHEDVIFKNEGQKYGQELIEIIDIKGKIIEVHPTEYSIIDPKMYKLIWFLNLKTE